MNCHSRSVPWISMFLQIWHHLNASIPCPFIQGCGQWSRRKQNALHLFSNFSKWTPSKWAARWARQTLSAASKLNLSRSDITFYLSSENIDELHNGADLVKVYLRLDLHVQYVPLSGELTIASEPNIWSNRLRMRRADAADRIDETKQSLDMLSHFAFHLLQ